MTAQKYQGELFVPLGDGGNLERLAAISAGARPADVTAMRIVRRSLDARKGYPVGYRIRFELFWGGAPPELPARKTPAKLAVPLRVVVVGSGPAGSFAALRLAEAGALVVVVEQGKPVQARCGDVAALDRGDGLDPFSNYCFGEGGAGTFSDGKLYTRARDRAEVDEVLAILVERGADPSIRVDARAHLGSNRLPTILASLRQHLESLGVEYRFADELVGLETVNGQVRAACLRSGAVIPCDRLVLAIGHSARATYQRLVDARVAAAPKPFAVGARIEHPQSLIDRIQYGSVAGHPLLPPAFYRLAATVFDGSGDRGVYSFCMCPGGFVINSSTEAGHLVTNGMSLEHRDSLLANAAIVVTVRPADFASFGKDSADPLAGISFQRSIEERAYRLGGDDFVAPAQGACDFVAGQVSTRLPRSSYRPATTSARLDDALPAFVAAALRNALPAFDRKMHGFLARDAQLVGVETRTSSPLRLLRDSQSCESLSHRRLYPCGEGSGYAGGIVSSAIDGLRVAAAILRDAD
ncbi:MAG: NAD(P)/FAD-dependent oxidoreductase [Pseudomonadota bacterium]